MIARKAAPRSAIQNAHIKALDKGMTKHTLLPVHCKVYSIRIKGPRRTCMKTWSSAPCRNVWYCAAWTTALSVSGTLKTCFTPSTTISTSSPCKWTVYRCPPNPFNRISPIGGTSLVTSTCSLRPARCRRTKGMV